MQFKQAAGAYFSVTTLSFILLLITSADAAASGFALLAQSGSGLGNAYAGAAASAEDASTIFFNPAGMALLEGNQFAFAVHSIGVAREFSGPASLPATVPPRPLGTVSDSNKRLAWIPNVYLVKELSPKLHFGTGINSPFGSTTEYQPGWVGRYQALKSKIETVNVNPSLSYLLNDSVMVGAGLNYQRARAEFTNAKNFGVGDGMVTMSGSDAAWGYNLGMLFKRNSGGRIGLTYRSSIQYRMNGAVRVTNPAGAVALNQAATADLKVPDSWSLSYFRAVDSKWDVMAELTHTGWSCFKELRVVQVSNGATLALTPENWRNTWRLALGANLHYSERWTARMGLAYDQSPVPDAFRTPRLPDSDRTMLSLGGQYRFDKGGVLDFGYAHLFVKDSAINKFVDTASARLAGSYSSQADVLSAQYSHGF